jgi:hypothetical protein
MKAAKYMWMYSLQNIGLAKSADHGRTLVARPLTSVNPVGWFIQPLTAMTNSDPATPAIAMGIPDRKWSRGESRSHPYAYIPIKIASRKKENPSSVNPRPKTFPKSCIHAGHSKPSSKDRIVPVTTPTANRASMIRDHRRARVR